MSVHAAAALSPDYLGLERWAEETPLAPALCAPGSNSLNYRALWDHLTATSAALADAGVVPGSVVALAVRNGPEFVTAVLAITFHAACAPVELDLTRDECRSKLERIKASTLLMEDAANDGAANSHAAVARELGMRIVRVRSLPGSAAGVFSVTDVENASSLYSGRQSDTALILMTSATTSLPKLVPRSRSALNAAAGYTTEAFQLTAADRYLSCMVLIHSHGITEVLTQLKTGGAVYCTPGFEADKFLAWIQDFGPTWFSVSPAMTRMILTLARQAPGVFRRSPLRFIRSSSATLDPEVVSELESLLGVPILNGYGMTEVASAMRSTISLRKPSSVGKSWGVEVAILDPAGNQLPAGGEGEVVLRGPTVMSGYLDNPEANQAAFHNGWFRTGDLGRLDDDGFLFLLGRLKEIINRGGKKISPAEVDQVLAKHPAVAEVATFAIPHRSLGEDVAAAVILQPGHNVSELDLRQFAARQLSAYKIPRRIVFVESIPHTGIGKPKRAALSEQFRDLGAPAANRVGASKASRAPSTVEAELLKIWESILGVEQIGIEDDFFDLGGDSLSAALMLAETEKQLAPSGFDPSGFFDQPTVASLAHILDTTAGHNADTGFQRLLIHHKTGQRDPFFCFASRSQHQYELRNLARELGPDQPFVVVFPPAPDAAQRFPRAAQIARQAMDSIRTIRKHGPYLIGGYCYGGVLAFETARQLTEVGEEVALLALFDTPTPGYPKIARAWTRYGRRASQILRDLASGRVSATPRDIAEHARMVWRIAARRWTAKTNRIAASAGLQEPPRPEEWSSVVMREYTPHKIRAPVVQFLAAEVPVNETVLTDRRMGWRDFAQRGFETIRVPGDHASMLSEANASVLANHLEQVLRARHTVESAAEVSL